VRRFPLTFERFAAIGVNKHGCFAAAVAEIVVIRNVAMKFLHSLQKQFVTLAVRAPENKPVSHPLKQSLECSNLGGHPKPAM
jgi:hypothetical protein